MSCPRVRWLQCGTSRVVGDKKKNQNMIALSFNRTTIGASHYLTVFYAWLSDRRKSTVGFLLPPRPHPLHPPRAATPPTPQRASFYFASRSVGENHTQRQEPSDHFPQWSDFSCLLGLGNEGAGGDKPHRRCKWPYAHAPRPE